MTKSMNDFLPENTHDRNVLSLLLRGLYNTLVGNFRRPRLVAAFIALGILLNSVDALAQTARTITGHVTDSSGKNALIGVTVTANSSKKSVVRKKTAIFLFRFLLQTKGLRSRMSV